MHACNLGYGSGIGTSSAVIANVADNMPVGQFRTYRFTRSSGGVNTVYELGNDFGWTQRMQWTESRLTNGKVSLAWACVPWDLDFMNIIEKDIGTATFPIVEPVYFGSPWYSS